MARMNSAMGRHSAEAACRGGRPCGSAAPEWPPGKQRLAGSRVWGGACTTDEGLGTAGLPGRAKAEAWRARRWVDARQDSAFAMPGQVHGENELGDGAA